MQKKIEIGITLGLIGLSLLIISVLIAGVIDLRLRDTSNLSLSATIGFILACFFSYYFPKRNTVTISKLSIIHGKTELIKEYIRDSESLFLYIALGYLGLLFCIHSTSYHFNTKWLVGLFFIFFYLQGLLTPFLGEKK